MATTYASQSRLPLTKNEHLLRWVEKMAELTRPAQIHWVDGSQEEYDQLCDEMVASGTFIRLNQKLWPGCFLARSDKSDVARVEDRTFICSLSKDSAGPTNNWEDPYEMRKKLQAPSSATPCTDAPCTSSPSAWAPSARPCRRSASSSPTRPTSSSTCASWPASACPSSTRSTRTTNASSPACTAVGAPLEPGQKDVPWPCNDEKYIVHFPETREIWSYGSGYGGNALLGKKCFALRIASNMARDEGWMAEHMLIVGVEDPDTAKKPTSPPPSPAPAARPISPC